MSAGTDKDKETAALIAELEGLRAEVIVLRQQTEARQSLERNAEHFFQRFSEALLRNDPHLSDGDHLSYTIKVVQKLLENFPNGSINVFDKELRYLFAAGKGLEEVNLASDYLIGKSLFELYPRKDAEHAATYYRLALEGQSVSFELPFSERLYTINAAPLEDKNGNIYAVIAVAQDITPRKQAEAALRELEQRAIRQYEQLLYRLTHLAEAFGAARDLMAIFRGLREFAVASVPCAGIFISLYDPQRKLRSAVYAWGDGEEVEVSQLPPMPITSEGPNSRAIRTGQIIITDDYSKVKHGVQTVSVGPNEDLLPLSSMAAPMSVMGRIVGTIEVQAYERAAYKEEHVTAFRMAANLAAVAIENVRLLEHEQLARAAAEESNRIKDEFLATLSHELRTPLTAVLGWTRLLRERELDEKTSIHALDIIERNAKAQKELIEEILDLSRIITGKTKLEVLPITLEPVVTAAIESVRPAACAKEIELEFTPEADVGVVSGDGSRLQQVIWNLLSNAVKFTPRGGRIHVRLARAGSQVLIEVTDSGEGIAAEFLPFVFDRFRQADGSSTRIHGGLGLGLAIVRHLVELHGGTVHADSAGKNQGSTFKVKLPLVAYSAAIEPQLEAQGISGTAENRSALESLKGLRVLVVDDEPDALEFLRVVLERNSAEVMAASSADEALQEVERFKPDVIISDIGMPGRDGYDLVRSLRQRESLVPAVALTAYARSEDEQRALREGFQKHIPKPFEPSELVAVIANLCRKNRE